MFTQDHEKAGEKVKMVVRTHSDAAKGMLHRAGCGRVRHFATRYFWHQVALRKDLINVERVETKDNAAALGTKMLDPQA